MRLRCSQRIHDVHARGAGGGEEAAGKSHYQGEQQRLKNNHGVELEAKRKLGEGLPVHGGDGQELHQRSKTQPDYPADYSQK